MILNNKVLFIRADASNSIGTGHIMRCLAIGQTWSKHGGKVTFISRDIPTKLETRLIDEDFSVIKLDYCELGSREDAVQTANQTKTNNGACVVVDGYYFGSSYQKIIKDYDLKLVFIDDYGHADYYYSDIVLNKSLIADTIHYTNKELNTKLLLGPKYNILRSEFIRYKDINPVIGDGIKEVLVTLGGADPNNITLKIITMLNQILNKNINVKVVIGSAYKHFSEIERIQNELNYDLQILRDVNNMADLMYSSDVAITAGGTTLFELAFMGLPSMVVQIASNQRSPKIFCERYGTCLYLGNAANLVKVDIERSFEELLNKDKRKTMSMNGKLLIDGEGNKRLINELTKIL